MSQPPEVLQKLVIPRALEEYLERGLPLVSGPVIPFDTSVSSWSSGDLLSAFEIDGDWRVFPADSSHVDVLRMPSRPLMHLSQPEHFGEPTPWPTFTTGFLNAAVPVWELAPTYLPAGSEIWRVGPEAEQTHIATFTGIAEGWLAAPASGISGPIPYVEPFYEVGAQCTFDGSSDHSVEFVSADTVTLHHRYVRNLEGFTEHSRGAGNLSRTVPVADCISLFAERLEATWNEIPVHFLGYSGPKALVQLADPQPHLIEPLNATLVDVNVFQFVVNNDEVIHTHSFVEEYP